MLDPNVRQIICILWRHCLWVMSSRIQSITFLVSTSAGRAWHKMNMLLTSLRGITRYSTILMNLPLFKIFWQRLQLRQGATATLGSVSPATFRIRPPLHLLHSDPSSAHPFYNFVNYKKEKQRQATAITQRAVLE